jgi:hypothetical protein
MWSVKHMRTANSTTDITNIEGELKPVMPKAQTPIFVLFTSLNGTMKAMEKASQIAQSSDGRIELLVIQAIPFPLQLNESQVSSEFLLKQLAKMAEQFSPQTRISALPCRDSLETLKRLLYRNCQVVMAVPRNKWLPNHDRTLARKLRGAGYNVTLVETA